MKLENRDNRIVISMKYRYVYNHNNSVREIYGDNHEFVMLVWNSVVAV